MVHLFEWKFNDIAEECEDFLGRIGYESVHVIKSRILLLQLLSSLFYLFTFVTSCRVSPINENLVIRRTSRREVSRLPTKSLLEASFQTLLVDVTRWLDKYTSMRSLITRQHPAQHQAAHRRNSDFSHRMVPYAIMAPMISTYTRQRRMYKRITRSELSLGNRSESKFRQISRRHFSKSRRSSDDHFHSSCDLQFQYSPRKRCASSLLLRVRVIQFERELSKIPRYGRFL